MALVLSGMRTEKIPAKNFYAASQPPTDARWFPQTWGRRSSGGHRGEIQARNRRGFRGDGSVSQPTHSVSTWSFCPAGPIEHRDRGGRSGQSAARKQRSDSASDRRFRGPVAGADCESTAGRNWDRARAGRRAVPTSRGRLSRILRAVPFRSARWPWAFFTNSAGIVQNAIAHRCLAIASAAVHRPADPSRGAAGTMHTTPRTGFTLADTSRCSAPKV